ncbi:MAG: acetolactate synthase small subunit [Candidatus Lindowbacteria bacterium RIFCSPLOWO2_12_FULL_62_27]|nr:MAG: acetolactate synthase small subunit [Candidatus Lindowbacteria bacterium RIFCSPLOWO2_02_FULL_62_12]OGH62410.1 MAG: acetolactate synthase small subunit [Candidatus Lindowbacteria bacterium RIFCSPLOWO2_12_FULL_62_27]
MRHVISILVQNKFGVLARISGLISARGFNIDSLTVGETEDTKISRMIIVVHGDDPVIEQIIKQLRRLVDTIKVMDLAEGKYVERELLLAKIEATPAKRLEILQIANVFGAKIMDMTGKDIIMELAAEVGKVDALIAILKPYGIRELARTGSVALARGGAAQVQAAAGATASGINTL